jgi:dipeptidyl aminopeptidase/acylaminoacyl peptidase
MEAFDLCLLRFVDDVALSADGMLVAFTVMRPDCEANRNRTSIWIASAAGGPIHRVTSDAVNASSPCWSPDGAHLAYTAAGQGISQIHLLDVASGEARQLTHDAAHAASSPQWSPNGESIAYLGKVPSLPDAEPVVTYPDAADRPRVIAWSTYKREGEGFLDHTRNQLFVMPARGGEPRQLTSFAMGIGGPTSASERRLGIGAPVWSPDGERIACVTYEDTPDGLCDVWTVAVADGALTRVTPHDGGYASPAWSPDGSSLAVIGCQYPRIGGTNNYLWIVPASGGPVRQVTDFDRSVGSGIMSDTGASDRSQPAWVGDDLYCLITNHGTAQIWRVSAAGGQPLQVTAGRHAIARWDIDARGDTLVYAASGPTNPGEVYCQRLGQAEDAVTQLTELNRDLLDAIDLNEPEEFWLPAQVNGEAAVQGWILKPPGFDPARKYPLLLEIHGGPAVSYGMSWFHEFQYFAACGYVLVYCNPRGSQGYGDRFATTIYQGWGPKPFEDVMHAVDYAAALDYIDPDALFVTGGSYGGYLTNWVVTHTDRFRAAATQRCVSDLRSLALAGDCNTIWMMDYYGGMPWDEPAVYAEDSPITHVARCTTPLFIEHEEEDHRDPMDQAEQMYNALRRLGIDTQLVRYPNESHGMSRNGKPLHRIDRLRRMRDWFARYR